MKEKITNGANDRPKDETLAQSGEGLPDDSGPIIDVDSNEVAKVREKLQGGADKGGRGMPGAEESVGSGAEEDTYD
jgi:hypothetical protein